MYNAWEVKYNITLRRYRDVSSIMLSMSAPDVDLRREVSYSLYEVPSIDDPHIFDEDIARFVADIERVRGGDSSE